jgi:hypothetical protein
VRRLPVLCPQEYLGTSMNVVLCTRCPSGWSKTEQRCIIPTGVEHLEESSAVPSCPIQDRCQHQLQSTKPCVVRSRGLICESALIAGGMSQNEAMDHPLGFHADMT